MEVLSFKKGSHLKLTNNSEIFIISGKIWITFEGDIIDYCYTNGEIATINNQKKGMIEFLEDSKIKINNRSQSRTFFKSIVQIKNLLTIFRSSGL